MKKKSFDVSLIQSIRDAGIIGCGGAGFPTHVKLSFPAKLIIANGVECEPLLSHDKYVMETQANDVIRGLLKTMKLTGAKRGIIALKKSSHNAIKSLEKSIKKKDHIRLHGMDDYYPAGDEQEIIPAVTGKRVPLNKYPVDMGIVVVNVITLIQIANALDGVPVLSRPITIAGDTQNPCIVDVPIGMNLHDVLKQTDNELFPDKRIISGGIMMGTIADSEETIKKTTQAILKFQKDHERFSELSLKFVQIKKQALSQCSLCQSCRDICPRYLLGHPIAPDKSMRSFFSTSIISEMALLCSECGLCSVAGCSMGIHPRFIHQHLKQQLSQSGHSLSSKKELNAEHPLRKIRRISSLRLKQKLKITEFDREPVKFEGALEPKTLKISLNQHIGNKAIPVVSVGQSVKCGECIGRDDTGDKMCVPVHSPVPGKITSIKDNYIEITRDK